MSIQKKEKTHRMSQYWLKQSCYITPQCCRDEEPKNNKHLNPETQNDAQRLRQVMILRYVRPLLYGLNYVFQCQLSLSHIFWWSFTAYHSSLVVFWLMSSHTKELDDSNTLWLIVLANLKPTHPTVSQISFIVVVDSNGASHTVEFSEVSECFRIVSISAFLWPHDFDISDFCFNHFLMSFSSQMDT